MKIKFEINADSKKEMILFDAIQNILDVFSLDCYIIKSFTENDIKTLEFDIDLMKK